MKMKELTLEGLYGIISKSSLVESNYDIVECIYNFYKIQEPRFKKKELCIRVYPNLNKEQAVKIDSYTYCNNKYLYQYSYYPCSEGFSYEENLRKLTKKEEELRRESLFRLPMGMSASL